MVKGRRGKEKEEKNEHHGEEGGWGVARVRCETGEAGGGGDGVEDEIVRRFWIMEEQEPPFSFLFFSHFLYLFR